MSNELVIAEIPIWQDENGRYNLNQLHQGSEYAEDYGKRPNRWTRLNSTQLLVEAIKAQKPDLASEPMEVVNGGYRKGVYAVEILAVEYAGWISPAFRLKVNQAFLDLKKGLLQPAGQSVIDPAMLEFLGLQQKMMQGHERILQILAEGQVAVRQETEILRQNTDNAIERVGIVENKIEAQERLAALITVKQAFKLFKIKDQVGNQNAGKIGKEAARRYRIEYGEEPHPVEDANYGFVFAYPEELLREVFSDMQYIIV